MLNKIDKRLLHKINIQEISQREIGVIVRAYDYNKTYEMLKKLGSINEIVELPIISSFGLCVDMQEIIKKHSVRRILSAGHKVHFMTPSKRPKK